MYTVVKFNQPDLTSSLLPSPASPLPLPFVSYPTENSQENG